jgi:hypothetical protein
MSKKQIKIVFIFDFVIHGFFGLGIHHKLFLIPLTFHLAIFCSLTEKFKFTLCSIIRSISNLDKVDETAI